MMDTNSLEAITLWAERSQDFLLGFWRPSHHDFWRDTAEMTRARPEKYYPTATFMAVAALRSETRPIWEDSVNGDLRFDWLAFLKGIEHQFEELLKSSEVSSRGAMKRWNVYTSAWSVRALDAARVALTHATDVSDSKRTKWLEWIATAINQQARKIARNIEQNNGAILPGGEGGAPHPFLTAHALAALRKADHVRRNHRPFISDTARRNISTTAKSQLERITASSAAGELQPADLIALPYYAAVLQAAGTPSHIGLVRHAIDLVCSSQVKVGGWPLVGSQLGSTGHGVQVSSFDIGATLINLCTRLQDDSQRAEDEQLRERAFAVLFDSLRKTSSCINTPNGDVHGWGSGHISPTERIDSWSTALAVRFLKKLQAYSQMYIQRAVLAEYGAIPGHQVDGWTSWAEIADPEPEIGIKLYIEEHFVETLSGQMKLGLPSKKDRNVSMILFGPPGTSKTTIAKALAKHLGWSLVTITPALFLARGVDGIDASATKVFANLRQLERAVVLFDECDELFRQRPTADDPSNQLSMAALITGAMLPRLQDLHDRGKLIFVLATNRLMAIDTAVRREGRIDHIIAIGPPNESARSLLVKAHAGVLPKRHRDMIVANMARFTRDEVIRTAEHLAKFYEANPKATPTQLKAEVQEFLGEQDLTIGAAEWKQFEELRDRFSRPHKPGWRD
jgi:hypothetical protein